MCAETRPKPLKLGGCLCETARVPKSYKLTHGRFRVEYGGMDGMCIMPDRLAPHWQEDFCIWLDDRLRGKRKLDALIHETLHAERPDLSEEEVTRIATNIMGVLWGEGYREQRK